MTAELSGAICRKGEADMVVEGAHKSNASSDKDDLMTDLATAGSIVQLQGAYETCRFAAGFGLTSPEQVRQWVAVLRGAAGGSPVFDGVVEAVYGDVLHSGRKDDSKETEGTWEDKFRSFAQGEFDVKGEAGCVGEGAGSRWEERL